MNHRLPDTMWHSALKERKESIQSGSWEGLAKMAPQPFCAAKPKPRAPGKVAQKLRRAHSQHSQTWLRIGTMDVKRVDDRL